MKWYDQLFEIPLFCGMLFGIVGVLMYCFSPKKINVFYGYRTPGSMASQERWDFAQKYSSVKLIASGIILLGCSLLGLIAEFQDSEKAISGGAIAFSIIFILFSTERTLNKRFPKK